MSVTIEEVEKMLHVAGGVKVAIEFAADTTSVDVYSESGALIFRGVRPRAESVASSGDTMTVEEAETVLRGKGGRKVDIDLSGGGSSATVWGDKGAFIISAGSPDGLLDALEMIANPLAQTTADRRHQEDLKRRNGGGV